MSTEDVTRNRPSDEGKNNDPNVRDRSAQQPGMNTISGSESDEANKEVTKTASEGDSPTSTDPHADKRFDE